MNWTSTAGSKARFQETGVFINLYDHSVTVGKVPGHANHGEKSWVLFKQ